MLDMLDEYSKGKVLTIQTQRKRKVKRNKKKKKELQVNNANELDEFANDPDYGEDSGAEESEEQDETNVERQFNYVSELSVLVDYNVIE